MAEAQRLLRLVTMFRGVLLYGDSGSGKSSLLNARFIPEAIADGFLPERIRVQPKTGAEIVVDRISVRERGMPPFLPSNLASSDSPRTVLSCEQLQDQISRPDVQGYPLLIFDQFEEFVTLFEVAPRTAAERAEAAVAQDRLVNLVAEFLVASRAPIKILFAFREDYFTKLQKLFARCRDLMDQSLRLLAAVGRRAAADHSRAFRKKSRNVCRTRFRLRSASNSKQNCVSAARAVCRIRPKARSRASCFGWTKEPEKLLATRKVQGLLEDFLVQQLEALPMAERAPAVALLSCLVTDAGTRNIVSRSDLVDRVTESESVTEEAVSTTLDALVQNTGLVRQEFRDRTAFYQIISEFLVPWIREQKADRARIEAERTLVHERQEAAKRLAQEREAAEQKLALQSAEADRRRAQDLAETLRKVRRSRAVLAVLLVLLLGGWSLAAWQTGQARREKAIAVQERNAADAAREVAAQEKESAKSAEDAARTALEKNSKLAVDAEKRLLAAGRALNQTKQTTQALLETMRRSGPGPDSPDRGSWNQLVQKLEEAVQMTDAGGQQVTTAIQLTKQEAAATTSAPGWSLYGKMDASGAWTDDRYFHDETSALAIPQVGEIIVADTFVNVRQSPSTYVPDTKIWRLAQIVGVIAPGQRIKVTEVVQLQQPPGDPIIRVWIRGEPAP